MAHSGFIPSSLRVWWFTSGTIAWTPRRDRTRQPESPLYRHAPWRPGLGGGNCPAAFASTVGPDQRSGRGVNCT